MAAGSDVRDILELEDNKNDEFITKDALFNDSRKVRMCSRDITFRQL